MKKSSAVKKSKPKQEEHSDVGRPKEIPTGQIRNVVADTIQRMYDEIGGTIDRVNAEEFARPVVLFIKHGVVEGNNVDRPRLREKTLKMPLCKACK